MGPIPPYAAWIAAGRSGSLLASAIAPLGGGILDPQGPVGDANLKILWNAVAIMLAIVVPTIIAVLAFAWWFRASNSRAFYLPTWAYSGRLELITWGLPLLVILFLSGVIWIGSHDLDPYRPLASEKKPLEVQVVSLDWKWLFIYPEHRVASVNELVIPAKQPTHFSLTTATVMNMFFVPQLGSMIATMPGMVTQLHLEADHAGEFYGQSAQYSGDGFSEMRFVVRAVPADAFAQWVDEARSGGPALDDDAYLALLHKQSSAPVSTFSSVDQDLFTRIVTGRLHAKQDQIGVESGPTLHAGEAQ
jgi:cytochrome o ubiquinol oxidase subunit II